MSNNLSFQLGGMPDDGFTVRNIVGCRLVFGPIPASEFGMLAHGYSKKAVMATDIAYRIGATCVIGEPENIEELREMDLPVSAKRHQDSLDAHATGLFKVALWLHAGDRGLSSDAMCKRIFGLPRDAGTDHPRDPSDLNRCLQFLDATDANDNVSIMRDVSPEWARLVENWDEIVSAFKKEKPMGFCPRTYALMQTALGAP